MLDIDWSKVPEGYDWAAQDDDGKICVFDSEPFLFDGELGVWDSFGHMVLIKNSEEPNADWQNTLTKRPSSATHPPDVGVHESEASPAEGQVWDASQEKTRARDQDVHIRLREIKEQLDSEQDAPLPLVRDALVLIFDVLPGLLEDREKLRNLREVLG